MKIVYGFISVLIASQYVQGASVVVIQPKPEPGIISSGPATSNPVGYSVEGVGQSVLITPDAGGLILGSFSFLNGENLHQGVIDSNSPMYVFREEYRGASTALLGSGVGSVGGPIGIAYWDSVNGFDFRSQEIELIEGEKLWFYTDSFTTLSLYEDAYSDGDFYVPDTDGDFGDPLAPPPLDFDVQFRMVAVSDSRIAPVPEPSFAGMLALSMIGLGRRRRMS